MKLWNSQNCAISVVVIYNEFLDTHIACNGHILTANMTTIGDNNCLSVTPTKLVHVY